MQSQIYRFYMDPNDQKKYFKVYADNIVDDQVASEMAKAMSLFNGFTADSWYVVIWDTKELVHKFINGAQSW